MLPQAKQKTEQPAPDPLLEALTGEAGASARAARSAELDAISARIEAQRHAGASRAGFATLELLSAGVKAAREFLDALKKEG